MRIVFKNYAKDTDTDLAEDPAYLAGYRLTGNFKILNSE
jgi:hypothetical protein